VDTFIHSPAEDRRLAGDAQRGDREALDALVRRHQIWIFHLASRMLWNRADAEDATQEIFVKAITGLGGFEGRSEFRTWLYRIAANHLLDRCRAGKTFEHVARTLSETPDRELSENGTGIERAVLIEEVKIACTTGILICLEPRQRWAFVLGEVLGVKDDVGGEMLEISAGNFRQILSRARRELYDFLKRQCGLVNEANACRCANKALGFVEREFVDPAQLPFSTERMADVRDASSGRVHELQELDRRYATIFRDQPLLKVPDQAAHLRELLEQTGVAQWMGTAL
jgi:RNA polymerase sigma factor (sigma-70 family)